MKKKNKPGSHRRAESACALLDRSSETTVAAVSETNAVTGSETNLVTGSETNLVTGSETNTVKDSIENTVASSQRRAVEAHTPLNQKFGAYELLWEIRRDALSKTYAARANNIPNLLAVRIFNARLTNSVQVRSIHNAAAKATELTHVNHVSVYDSFVSEDGSPYVVSDLVEGQTLSDVLLVVKRLDIARALSIFTQIGEVLSEAHSRDLVHGNLSPEKILITTSDAETDLVKLVDFGMPADPVQCAFYLAPEQSLDRGKVDARTDIYSLGCIMYEALVGTPPMVHHNLTLAGLNCLHELASHYSPQSAEHKALKLLDSIVIKCMQKESAKRFRNVRELMDALKLVNDCICGGSTRKLPHKAEKLLLFRFLDTYDKKIVACLAAYILLAAFICHAMSEIQLQKDIDDAQRESGPATQYWRAAIQHAQQNHSAPKLLAELHWNLADSLIYRPLPNNPAPDAQRLEAIKEYEKALQYYGKGMHYRSNALALLSSIDDQWMEVENKEAKTVKRSEALRTVQKLFREKKFAACANTCTSFLLKEPDDNEIEWYAARSYNEQGLALPSAKAIRKFEDAVYYAELAGRDVAPASSNLAAAIQQSNLLCDRSRTHAYLAKLALKDGDVRAADIEFGAAFRPPSSAIRLPDLFRNRDLLEHTYQHSSLTGDQLRLAITALERTLKLKEQMYGVNDGNLVDVLSKLANCYRTNGQTEKAIVTYKRRLALDTFDQRPDGVGTEIAVLFAPDADSDTQALADLLVEKGQPAMATKILEDRVFHSPNRNISSNPLSFRLVQAYLQTKNEEQAQYLLDSITPVIPSDGFDQAHRVEPVAYSSNTDDAFAPQY